MVGASIEVMLFSSYNNNKKMKLSSGGSLPVILAT
jgi:hypothetical protein